LKSSSRPVVGGLVAGKGGKDNLSDGALLLGGAVCELRLLPLLLVEEAGMVDITLADDIS
jgi:hypothetical protein